MPLIKNDRIRRGGWLPVVNQFLLVDEVITLLGRREGGFPTPMNSMNTTLSYSILHIFLKLPPLIL